MRIAEVRVRQVAIPRIYDTYCADPKNLKDTIDHGRSTYQVVELKTRGGPAGIGEVSDIAPADERPVGRSPSDPAVRPAARRGRPGPGAPSATAPGRRFPATGIPS